MNWQSMQGSTRWAMVPLRLGLGLVFLMHGWQKVFVYGLAGTSGAFQHMGIPLAQPAAALVMIVEVLGGPALMLGLRTRLFAAAFTIEMAVVVFFVKHGGGLFGPRGSEFEMLLMLGSLTLALAGAGAPSVDDALARRKGAAG